MSKKQNAFAFHLLPESPINEDKKLEFGHKEITSTLQKIISGTDHNLTIGLFGSWGTGKSTIVETLKQNLKIEMIPLVVFDVWKHEGDALRRTFLKELDAHLSGDEYGENYVKEKHVLHPRVYASLSTASETYKFLTEKMKLHFFIMGLFVLTLTAPLVILYHFFYFFFDVNIFGGLTVPALGAFTSTLLTGGLLFKYIDSFIKTEKVDTKHDKFQDPHEFENEFNNIVANLRDNIDKIVVTFDNLDRVSGDNALKIISTIKTFLNCKKYSSKTVFFLIPCDVEAMKSHIAVPLASTKGTEKEMYLEEFLRKFFNTSIWIPEFFSAELENFATLKLEETGVEEFKDDYLSWLITRVFNQNPRQIIQFVNLLLANYLLLKEFCETDGLSDKHFYKNNVAQLAKFLLIKQKYPDYLDSYRKFNIYNLQDNVFLDDINDENFKSLLTQTEDIHISSLEPYFKYRLSKDEQKIPGVSRLFQLMDQDDEDAVKYATEIHITKNIAAFNSVLKTYLQPINNPVKKIKFINELFRLIEELSININNGLKRDIINFLCSDSGGKNYNLLNPKLVTNVLFKKSTNLTAKDRIYIINFYLQLLNTRTYLNETVTTGNKDYQNYKSLLLFFVDNQAHFNVELTEGFKNYLRAYFGDPLIKEVFFSNQSQPSAFIDSNFMNAALNGIKPNNKSFLELLELLDLINLFKPKEIYYKRVLEVLFKNWKDFFSETLYEKYSTICLQTLMVFVENIEHHINQEIIDNEEEAKIENILSAIFEIIYMLGTHRLNHFMPFIASVYKLQKESWPNKLFYQLLEFTSIDAITLYCKLPISLTSIITSGTPILKRFTKLFIENPEVQELTKELIDPQIYPYVIIEAIREESMALANEYLHEYRREMNDEYLAKTKELLLEKIQFYIKETQLAHLIDVIKLFKFVCDNNRQEISKSSFWESLAGLIIKDKDVECQELGYQLFKENQTLLINEKSHEIAEYLLAHLLKYEFINNYYLHEVLAILYNNLKDESQHQYITFIYQEVFAGNAASNVLIVCSKILEKSKYDPLEFTDPISYLIDTAEKLKSTDQSRFHDYQQVLRDISKKLNKNNSDEALELKLQIKTLIY